MINKKQIKYSNYEKASKLLSKLIDAESDEADQINNLIKQYGVVKFFETLEKHELSPDILKKLHAVKFVLFAADEANRKAIRG